jgi:hypothetical protein
LLLNILNSFQDLCEDGVDPVVGLGGVGGGHRHSIWSRDNLHAQSYRDMRDIVALPPPTSSSRDNTLSRDMHHINVSLKGYSLLVRYSFIVDSQNVDFLDCLGRNNKSAKKSTNYLPHRVFCVPLVSINCLACPKGVKYKRISIKQAVTICRNPESKTDKLTPIGLNLVQLITL